MNGIHYLSSLNNVEDNLKIIAEDKILVTKEAELLDQQLQQNRSKQFLALASSITTLAIGIILGVSISAIAGACVAIGTIIPFAIWMNFREKTRSVQMTFDKEKEKLEKIFQQMINVIRARHQLVQRLMQVVIEDLPPTKRTMDLIDEDKTTQAALPGLVEGLLVKAYQDLKDVIKEEKEDPVKFYKDIEKERTSEEEKKNFLDILELFKSANFDPNANLGQLRKYAETIAHSNLQTSILENRWQELQKICKDYIQPYHSHFKLENGQLVYNAQ